MSKQAVTENSEVTARTLKNFRTSPDVETFYRFVHDIDFTNFESRISKFH